MKRILGAAFAITAAVALSGCPSKTVQEGGRSIVKATDAQCRTERDIFEKAVESFTLLNGVAPASEAAMVPDWLRQESVYYDLSQQGTVVASPTGGCTV